MTPPLWQAVVETAQSPEVGMTTAVAAIVALGKIWDKVVGRGRDKAARQREQDIGRRLEDHAKSDAEAFGKIHTSMAVLEVGVGVITKQLGTLDQRLYDARKGN